MTNIGLFSDLDLTLLFSPKRVKKFNESCVNTIVMEEYNDHIASLMSYSAFKELVYYTSDQYLYDFIPTTTRDRAQYSRISLSSFNPSHTILLNGAMILEKGILDTDWQEIMNTESSCMNEIPINVYRHIAKTLSDYKGFKNIRYVDGGGNNDRNSFLYVVMNNENDDEILKIMYDFSQKFDYILSHQNRKIYLIPQHITKGRAIDYVKKKQGYSITGGMGDSVLDASMIKNVDHFIAPAHSSKTLLKIMDDYNHTFISNTPGIQSSYEMLVKMRKNFINV